LARTRPTREIRSSASSVQKMFSTGGSRESPSAMHPPKGFSTRLPPIEHAKRWDVRGSRPLSRVSVASAWRPNVARVLKHRRKRLPSRRWAIKHGNDATSFFRERARPRRRTISSPLPYRSDQCITTFPDWPDFIKANASSKSRNGNWWVITGVISRPD
jgi:hypothetical protein